MDSSAKRLCKSRTDRMIDGICGGIAEYFGLDSTLVRIAWVLLTFFGGSGIILYIVAMIIMPAAPVSAAQIKPQSSGTTQKFWGFLLITVGALWLLSNLGFSFWRHWWGFSWDVVLAMLLILGGVAFLFGGRSYVSATHEQPGGQDAPDQPVTPSAAPVHRLYRSRQGRKLFGVCGGLGPYFNVDPTIVRLVFVVSAIASFGLTLVAYFVMAIIVPEEPILFQTQ